jgi:hypothetical protein
VRDCRVLGEQFVSCKVVNPMDVEITGCEGVAFMVQGTTDLEWRQDKEPARNVVLRNLLIDSDLGYSPLTASTPDAGQSIQVSWHVRGLRIEGCTLNARGKGGSAIQLALDCHADIRGCTINGYNGMAGIARACALNLSNGGDPAGGGCSVNPDFATANTFVNQERILDS